MFGLQLSQQMMAVIIEALNNHPYREAAPVLNELQRQLNSQMRPPGNGGAQDQHEAGADRPVG